MSSIEYFSVPSHRFLVRKKKEIYEVKVDFFDKEDKAIYAKFYEGDSAFDSDFRVWHPHLSPLSSAHPFMNNGLSPRLCGWSLVKKKLGKKLD